MGTRRQRIIGLAAVLPVIAAMTPSPAGAAPPGSGRTTLVSAAIGGAEPGGESWIGGISADSRYVAFTSVGSNLVAGDTNDVSDVFVRDLRTRSTQRVSVGTGGAQADQTASDPSISADGRYVAFHSWATNLVPGDTNERGDIFVRDRRAGTTVRVSLTETGGQAGNTSEKPAISADGRYVAFTSHAENLVAGDDNGEEDVFVHDRRTHRTQRVSVAHTGGSSAGRSNYPAISANGRYVAFMSSAPDLVADGSASGGLFLRDLRLSTTVLVSRTDTGAVVPDPGPPDISGDGRYVTFATSTDGVAPGDRNGLQDVVVRDLRTGRNKLASVSSTGGPGDDNSAAPAISPDGRYVTFLSWATNLVPGDGNGFGDIFLHDRRSGTTERVSVQTSGAEADSVSDGATVSTGGRAVAITSYATNLAPGDTDHAADVYVWVRR